MSQAFSDVGTYTLLPHWLLDAGVPANAIRLFAILGKYADRDTGECIPGRKRLAEQLGGVSLDTLDRAKRELVRAGALVVEARDEGGRQTSNRYFLRYARPGAAAPGAESRTRAADPSRMGAAPRTRTSKEPDAAAAARARDPLFDLPAEFRPREVDGKPVTAAEASRATQLLATFNRLAETRFKSQEYLRGIILRIRRFPEVNDVQHELAMSHVLTMKGREKWWSEPAPNIVYGNDATFERALHGSRRKASAPPSGFEQYAGGRSADDVLREQLGEEGFAAWQAEQDAEEARSIRARGVPEEISEFRERIGEERFRVAWGEAD